MDPPIPAFATACFQQRVPLTAKHPTTGLEPRGVTLLWCSTGRRNGLVIRKVHQAISLLSLFLSRRWFAGPVTR
jgi:hypothetical protein